MIIDGKALAEKLKKSVEKKSSALKVQPGLGMILLGDNPASQIYVRSKERACKEAGF